MHGMLRIQTHTDDPPRERDEPVSALVSPSKRGNVTAFTQLYRDHVDRVYDYAARRLDSLQSAEEVTREVFNRAFRGIAGCRDEEAFAGWLFANAPFIIADIHSAKSRATAPLDAAAGIAYVSGASGAVSSSTVRTASGVAIVNSDVTVEGNRLEEVVDGVTGWPFPSTLPPASRGTRSPTYSTARAPASSSPPTLAQWPSAPTLSPGRPATSRTSASISPLRAGRVPGRMVKERYEWSFCGTLSIVGSQPSLAVPRAMTFSNRDVQVDVRARSGLSGSADPFIPIPSSRVREEGLG